MPLPTTPAGTWSAIELRDDGTLLPIVMRPAAIRSTFSTLLGLALLCLISGFLVTRWGYYWRPPNPAIRVGIIAGSISAIVCSLWIAWFAFRYRGLNGQPCSLDRSYRLLWAGKHNIPFADIVKVKLVPQFPYAQVVLVTAEGDVPLFVLMKSEAQRVVDILQTELTNSPAPKPR